MSSYWESLRELYKKYKCFDVNFFPRNYPDPKKMPLICGVDDSGSTSILTYQDLKNVKLG